jgi:DUF971 family protein
VHREYDRCVQDDARTTPTRIDANRAEGTLRVEWADGHQTAYDATTLRWLCPCAYCRGEAGMPGWLDTNPTLTADQTRLVDVSLVGNYAVQPLWGDGHHTGYHTFMLLRDRCPCDACARDRASRHEGHASSPAPQAARAGDRHWHGGDR